MIKIKHIWSVLCRNSVIDRDNNNVSLQSVLEQLTVSLVPKDPTKKTDKIGVPLDYEVVSLWQKVEDLQIAEGEIEYILSDPKGKELLRNTQVIKIPKTSRRFRSRMKITGLPLTSSGEYVFQIKLKEKGSSKFILVSEIPIDIDIKLKTNTLKSN